jgi:hypothetical protein
MRHTSREISDRGVWRSLLSNREGTALVITLLITLGLTGLVFGVLIAVQTETRLTSNRSMRQKTFYLAERGVEETIAYLAQTGVPLLGAGPDGGGPVQIFDTQTTAEGSFEAWADPLDSNMGRASRFLMVTVRATLAGTAVSNSVRIKLGQENFARFAYFTNEEHHAGGGTIWFLTGDEFYGPVYSNDQLHIHGDPIFHDAVVSGAANIDYYDGGPPADNPVFEGGITFNGDVIELPSNTDLVKVKGLEPDGLYFDAANVTIEMFVNAMDEGKLNVKINNGEFTEYDLPANGVCYVSGNALVSGTLKGQVTIVSDKTIEIMDNIVYHTDPRIDPESTDILGLFAEGDVVMDGSPGCPNNDIADETVMGALMALKYSFTVENHASGTPRGALVLYGGIIQTRRGPIGSFSGASGQTLTGYTKDYTYDPRLRDYPPPAFPTTGQVLKISWEEIAPNEDISANFW